MTPPITPAQKIASLLIVYLTGLMHSPGLSDEEYAAAEAKAAQLSNELP
jgi:hypothetical protein